MRRTNKDVLKMICTLGRVTEHHLTIARSVSVPNSKGANKLKGTDNHIKILVKKGLIEKIPNNIVRKEMARWQYFQATDAGFADAGIKQNREYGFFPIEKENDKEHQHGLMTVLAGIYLAYNSFITVEYPRGNKAGVHKYGFKVDAIVHVDEGPTFNVEFENAKSFNAVSKVFRERDKKIILPKNGKIIWVFNSTRNANKNSVNVRCIDPSAIHDEPNPIMERKTEKFVADLLYENRDLPSHKHRVACLHEFEDFGNGIWRAPGKRETFKI